MQSGKELLKCSMHYSFYWIIYVQLSFIHVLVHACTIPSSSSMRSYIRWHWPSRVKMFVSFMHASVAGVISVGHLVVATSTMEVHKRLMFAG